jgi:hypothetical protein
MYECLHLSFFHATSVESMPGTAITYVWTSFFFTGEISSESEINN